MFKISSYNIYGIKQSSFFFFIIRFLKDWGAISSEFDLCMLSLGLVASRDTGGNGSECSGRRDLILSRHSGKTTKGSTICNENGF